MRHSLIPPCAAWAEPLAKGHPNDLTPAARAALDTHVATCAACAAARADYAAMDARLRALPAVPPLAALPAIAPPRAADTGQLTRSPAHSAHQVIAFPGRGAPPARPRPEARLVARLGGLGRAVALVAVLAVMLGGYALLLHRQGTGPASLPAYSTAHIGAFHLVQPPAPGAEITVQGSVPGLLYACIHSSGGPVNNMKPPRFWRSEDGGATWRALPTPAALAQAPTSFCFVGVSPADPDTIFSVTNSGLIYSTDRGEHWAEEHGPSNASRSARGAEPFAVAGGVWVIRDGDSPSPVVWVSRDHGAHWSRYSYPVPLNASTPCCADSAVPLMVGRSEFGGYSRGGFVWKHDHTLWWTPDYGAHWQQLGLWNDPPSGGWSPMFGTADLSVFYAYADDTSAQTLPFWRSTDMGRTWQPAPPAPAVRASQGHPVPKTISPQLYQLLRDGTLLAPAPMASNPEQVAFYTLAPGGTEWRQASGPLPSGLCQVVSVNPAKGLFPCAQSFAFPVVDTGQGTATLYVTSDEHPDEAAPMWAAPITWQ